MANSVLDAADQATLDKLAEDYARDGKVAIERFRQNDPASYLRIFAAIDPQAVTETLAGMQKTSH